MSKAVVGLDCTGETFCCGILVDGREQTSLVGFTPRRALRDLPGHIGYLIKSAGLSYRDVEAVGVTVGPGSFTGVRLGVTLARTVALTCGCRTAPLDTLEVIARGTWERLGLPDGAVAVALDARRGEVYSAVFSKNGNAVNVEVPTKARKPADFRPAYSGQSRLVALVGSGFAAYPDLQASSSTGLVLTEREFHSPRPETICSITHQMMIQERLSSFQELLPMYHREAEVQVSGGAR